MYLNLKRCHEQKLFIRLSTRGHGKCPTASCITTTPRWRKPVRCSANKKRETGPTCIYFIRTSRRGCITNVAIVNSAVERCDSFQVSTAPWSAAVHAKPMCRVPRCSVLAVTPCLRDMHLPSLTAFAATRVDMSLT